MVLSDYFLREANAVSFSEEQASSFAKGVAGDFNPLHDPDNKRFCVPGDLLFSVLLNHYGVASTTGVQFSGMLDGNTRMLLPEEASEHTVIVDDKDKALLSLFLQGPRIHQAASVNNLCEEYVKFSGQTFPDILVPLMRDASVMINPARPMVIYKDMSIEIEDDKLDALSMEGAGVKLALADTDISVNGRKGAVRLQFSIEVNSNTIGMGVKNMVLSGLREYDEAAMQNIVSQYTQWRADYRNGSHAA